MTPDRPHTSFADPAALEIVTRRQGATLLLECSGEWDLAGESTWRQSLAAAAVDGWPDCLVLDLTRLTFIDSTGVHACTGLAERAERNGIHLVILVSEPAVRNAFEILGLFGRLPLVDSPSLASARSTSAASSVGGRGDARWGRERWGRQRGAGH